MKNNNNLLKKLTVGLFLVLFITTDAFNCAKAQNVQQSSKENVEQPTPPEEKKAPNLSPIETIFNPNVTTDNVLYQFGYDIFKKRLVNTSLEQDRTLLPGDSLLLNIWGEAVDILISNNAPITPTMPLIVNRDGFVTIPTLGTVFVTGLTIKEAQTEIQALFDQKYIGIQSSLSLEQASSISIYIAGEVETPGVLMVPTSATIIDALSLAGGINKSGTLRNIVITNNNSSQKFNVDLYQYLRYGKSYSRSLQKGDTILVPPVGNVVALRGAVLNPAIYEFKKNENIVNIVEIAGGLLPSVNKNRIQIDSYNLNDNSKTIKDFNFSSLNSIKLHNGDLLTFYQSSDDLKNSVAVSGNVKDTGPFELTDNMKLSDLLKDKNNLLAKTYEDVVEVQRETGLGKNPKSFNLSLKKIIMGDTDLILEPKDQISVLKSTTASQIKVSGSVNNPGYYTLKPNMTVNDIIGQAELSYPSENMVLEITKKDKSVTVIYLYDLLTLNRTNLNLPLEPEDNLFFRTLSNSENLKTVTVLGFVNNPGVYKLQENLKLAGAVNLAGGLMANSYVKGIVFARRNIRDAQNKIIESLIKTVEADMLQNSIKASQATDDNDKKSLDTISNSQKLLLENLKKRGQELYGRLVLDVDVDPLALDINIKDGDVIYIPESHSYVLVAGEVYNQSAILFDPKKTVKDYINKVGGFTVKAAKKEAYISKINGTVIALRQSRGKFYNSRLDPGDAVIIPSKTKPPFNTLQFLTNITDIVAKLGTSAFILLRI